MLAKLRGFSMQAYRSTLVNPMATPFLSSTALRSLTQVQVYQFGHLQQRINRRLRRYRQDKIQKESSFNKNDGKYQGKL